MKTDNPLQSNFTRGYKDNSDLKIHSSANHNMVVIYKISKTSVKWPLSKRPKIGFQDQLLLNAGQKYCKMLQGEHSAILLTFIKLPFVIKISALSIFSGHFSQVLLYLVMFGRETEEKKAL